MDSKEDEKSHMYQIALLDNVQDERSWEDEEISEGDEEISEGDEELVQMEVERALKHIVSHNNTTMYCPDCFALINTISTRKEEIVRCKTPEVSKCFSFFSLFIPSGDCIKLWPFGKNKTRPDGKHTKLQFDNNNNMVNYAVGYGATNLPHTAEEQDETEEKYKTKDMDSKSKNSTIQKIEEDTKSPAHSITPLQEEQEEMLEEEEEKVELELERAINHIDTHGDTTMYCDNCTIRLTKVLVRKGRVIQPPTSEGFRYFSFIPSGAENRPSSEGIIPDTLGNTQFPPVPHRPRPQRPPSTSPCVLDGGVIPNKTKDMDSKSKNSTIQKIEEDTKSPAHSITSLQEEQEEMLEEEEILEVEELELLPVELEPVLVGECPDFDSEEHEKPHKDVIVRTSGGKGKIKPK